MVPFAWVWNKRRVRLKTFAAQLPDALELIARALRAGHALGAGMHVVAEEMPPPVSDEFVFFFKQKTAYDVGLGIPAEPLFRSIYARFDKNDWRIQPAEFYRFHDAEVNTFGYF